MGPTLETESELFLRILRFKYQQHAEEAFLNCLQALPGSNQQVIVGKYIGVCKRVFKDPLFVKKLEKMGLFTPTPSLVALLLNFSVPSAHIETNPDIWFYNRALSHAHRVRFQVCPLAKWNRTQK